MMDMNEDSLDAPPSVGSLESSSPAPNKKKGRTPLSDNTRAFLCVPYSVLLIPNKFCKGGSRTVIILNRPRVVKLLNSTGGVVWALKSPSEGG
jgi:hypothetical protein